MNEEIKIALKEAKENPTEKNIAKAEEAICQNGADNKLKELVTQTHNKLKKGNLSKQEKDQIIVEILALMTSENKYQKQAFQKYQHELNKLLTELQGGTSQQEDSGIPWLKILGIGALVALSLIALAMIMRARRRKLARGR
jgi:lipopolysaccharide export LptBFGC system permease protein LptF